MSLSVTIPQDWVAVGNERETRYEHANEEGRRVLEKHGLDWFLNFYADPSTVAAYQFERTPRISTYLYALCVGPYKSFVDYDPMHVP